MEHRTPCTAHRGARGWSGLNTANRSFAVLVAVALIPVALLAVAGCAVLGWVAYRLAADGWSALSGEPDLRPAVTVSAIVAASLGGGGRALWLQLAATIRLDRSVNAAAVPTPERVHTIAARFTRRPRVVVVGTDEPFSFAYGLSSPQVVVSTALLDALSDEEVAAVLEHERYHLRARDPLKVVVARTFTAAFFYLPALHPLTRRYLASREIAADGAAVRATGRRALAGALYRATSAPGWAELGGAAALGGPTILEDRVTHLETGQEPAPAAVSRLAIAATAVVVVLLAGALVYTVVQAGGPSGLMRGRMDRDMGTMNLGGPAGAVVSTVPWIFAGGWLGRRTRRRRA